MSESVRPESWLKVLDDGLYCIPGDFYIDPVRPVGRALITHGHADHARPNHGVVMGTVETLAIMRQRYREAAGRVQQSVEFGQVIDSHGVKVAFFPAGHILGSSQIRLEYEGTRVVVSGDYKRRRDPTCTAFEPVPCDVFITEATFGLPVFRHPPDASQVD